MKIHEKLARLLKVRPMMKQMDKEMLDKIEKEHGTETRNKFNTELERQKEAENIKKGRTKKDTRLDF